MRLTIEDYPYAADGLDLWVAIRQWAHDYVRLYYKDDKTVQDDRELQNWWSEIKEVGHGDHAGAEWWSPMNKVEDIEEAMSTIIWVTSGFHASVNFGNYAYAGYSLSISLPPIFQNILPSSMIDGYVYPTMLYPLSVCDLSAQVLCSCS